MGCPTWTISCIKWMEYFADLLFYWTGILILIIILVRWNMLMIMPAPFVIAGALGLIIVLKTLVSLTILCGLHDTWGLFTSLFIYALIFLGLAAIVLKTKAPIIMEYASPAGLLKLKPMLEKLSACVLDEGAASANNALNQQMGNFANNLNQQVGSVGSNMTQQVGSVGSNMTQQVGSVGSNMTQQIAQVR